MKQVFISLSEFDYRCRLLHPQHQFNLMGARLKLAGICD